MACVSPASPASPIWSSATAPKARCCGSTRGSTQLGNSSYQVYCLEHPLENAVEHSDGRARDEDGDRSVHTLRAHQTDAFAETKQKRGPQPKSILCRSPEKVARMSSRSLYHEMITSQFGSKSTEPWRQPSKIRKEPG